MNFYQSKTRFFKATILITALTLVASSTWAAKGGGGKPGGGGGGPSDRPGDTSVCATFDDKTGDAIVSDMGDGLSPYCDETDGAWLISGMNGNFISGEFGSKKFNSNKRVLLFKSNCDGIDDQACDPDNGVEIEQFWAAYEYDSNGSPVGNGRLQWTAMTVNQVTRVSVNADLGRTRGVSFGNTNGVNIGCTASAVGTGPAWVSCNSANTSGCNSWTLSSFDLSGGNNDALACLKSDGLPDETIAAPFAVEIIAVP